MLKPNDLQVAAGATSLGMISDDVVVATIHYRERKALDERDRSSLEKAGEVLKALAELGGTTVAGTEMLRSMSSLDVLDETLEAVSSARPSGKAVVEFAREFAKKIDEMIAGSADPEVASQVGNLFERLSVVTLRQAEDLLESRRRGRWMQTLLLS